MVYLIITLLFGFALDIIWKRRILGIEEWFQQNLWWWYDTDPKTQQPVLKNTIFYNLISVARLLCFATFFGQIGYSFKQINKFIIPLFLFLSAINFIGFENIKDFSSRQLTVEAAILLFYCLLYFYKTTMDDTIASPMSLRHFWVVTGLALYTAVNFFIFLFYRYLMTEYKIYSQNIWNVHNISFILLNMFIAIALYRAK